MGVAISRAIKAARSPEGLVREVSDILGAGQRGSMQVKVRRGTMLGRYRKYVFELTRRSGSVALCQEAGDSCSEH